MSFTRLTEFFRTEKLQVKIWNFEYYFTWSRKIFTWMHNIIIIIFHQKWSIWELTANEKTKNLIFLSKSADKKFSKFAVVETISQNVTELREYAEFLVDDKQFFWNEKLEWSHMQLLHLHYAECLSKSKTCTRC